jgi:transposase
VLWFVRYADGMRYGDGGGLTARGRAQREAVRRQAAQMFAAGATPVQVATRLRVTPKSARSWRRAWQNGGTAALASTGPGGARCRLDAEQITQLEAALDAGPAAHGWIEDQRWTLARVAMLIKELFGVGYTLKGVSVLLHRIGFSPQVPVHRAAERDEKKITEWREATWPEIKGRPATWARGSPSPTSPASRSGRPRRVPGPDAGAPRSCG